MANPLWRHPGTRTGRIIPTQAAAQGNDEDWYYGFVWYSYSYSYQYYSGQVFCLGDESLGANKAWLPNGAEVTLEQDVDVTDLDLIRFCWYLVNRDDMPVPRTLQSAGPVDFADGGLIGTNTAGTPDSCQGVILPTDAEDLLTEEDEGGVIRVAGTDHNDGDHVLRSVPWELRPQCVRRTPAMAALHGGVVASPTGIQRQNGQVALLDDLVLPAESPAAATITKLGARWAAEVYIDAELRCRLAETPGRFQQRSQLALHVSKLTGVHTLKFRLVLEYIES